MPHLAGMLMSSRTRRFVLTAHVVSSVGWLGAVAGTLALAIAGVTSADQQTVRAVYLSMEIVGWYALVPLSLAALSTGLLQGLGSRWGLLRYYWVVTKLLINVVSSVVLVFYMGTLGALADAARTDMELAQIRTTSPVLHAGAALVLLLAAAVLSVYKPPGLTRYGWRKQQQVAMSSRG